MYVCKENAPIYMYYVAPETPMMSSVIADCPEIAPPNILDKSTPMIGSIVFLQGNKAYITEYNPNCCQKITCNSYGKPLAPLLIKHNVASKVNEVSLLDGREIRIIQPKS